MKKYFWYFLRRESRKNGKKWKKLNLENDFVVSDWHELNFSFFSTEKWVQECKQSAVYL